MESMCSLGMCCTMLGLAYVLSAAIRRRFRKYARRKLKDASTASHSHSCVCCSFDDSDSDIQGEESVDSRLECEVHIIHIPTRYFNFRVVEVEAVDSPPPDYETAAASTVIHGHGNSESKSGTSPPSLSSFAPPTYDEAMNSRPLTLQCPFPPSASSASSDSESS